MAVKTYPIDIAAELKTEKEIEGFIEAAVEEAKNDTDPVYLIHALDTADRARAMLATARRVYSDREAESCDGRTAHVMEHYAKS